MHFSSFLSITLAISTVTVLGQNLFEAINTDTSLQTFSKLLKDPNYSQLKDTLTGSEEFTVFAPTDSAFTNSKLDLNLPKTVLAYLEYLTVYGNFAGQTLTTKHFPFTLLKDPTYVNQDGNVQVLIFDKNNSQPFISQGLTSANVTKLDAHKAANGVVHVVDALLPPPNAPAQVIREAGFSEMADAVERAALENQMNDLTALTIFAPTNEALTRENFGEKTRPQLSPIVKNHVIVDDIVLSQKLQDGAKFQSVLGYSLNIKATNGSTYVNGCRIIRTDILTNNGVMHIIDDVIALPSNFHSNSSPQCIANIWVTFLGIVLAVAWRG